MRGAVARGRKSGALHKPRTADACLANLPLPRSSAGFGHLGRRLDRRGPGGDDALFRHRQSGRIWTRRGIAPAVAPVRVRGQARKAAVAAGRAAMRLRETCGKIGPRIYVRLFGGRDVTADDAHIRRRASAPDRILEAAGAFAHQRVPPGGVHRPVSHAPRAASRDGGPPRASRASAMCIRPYMP